MIPMGEVWVCVRISAQLVAIDSNRRLSRIVKNLIELPSIVVLMASGMVLRMKY